MSEQQIIHPFQFNSEEGPGDQNPSPTVELTPATANTQRVYDEVLRNIKVRNLDYPTRQLLESRGFEYAAGLVDTFQDGIFEFIQRTEVESFGALLDIIAKPDRDTHPYTQESLLRDLEIIREKYGMFMVCTEVGGGPKLVGKVPPIPEDMSDQEGLDMVRTLVADLQSMGYHVGLGFNDHSFMTTYRSPRVGTAHIKEDGTIDDATLRDIYGKASFAAARQYQSEREALVNGQLRPARIANHGETPTFYNKEVGLMEEHESVLVPLLRSHSIDVYREQARRLNYRLAAGKIEHLNIGGWRRQSFDVVGSGKIAKKIHDIHGSSPEGLEEWLNFLILSAAILSQAHHLHQHILEEEMYSMMNDGIYIPEDVQQQVRNGYGLRLGEWVDIVYPDIWRYAATQENGHSALYYFNRYNAKVSELTYLMNMTFTMNADGEYAATNFPIPNYFPGNQWEELRAEGTFYNWTTQGLYLDRRGKREIALAESAGVVQSSVNYCKSLSITDSEKRPDINVTEYTTNPLFARNPLGAIAMQPRYAGKKKEWGVDHITPPPFEDPNGVAIDEPELQREVAA